MNDLGGYFNLKEHKINYAGYIQLEIYVTIEDMII
jgi:hypothetical protein